MQGTSPQQRVYPNVGQSMSSQRQVCQVFGAWQLGQSLSQPIIKTESSPEKGFRTSLHPKA